MRLSKDIHTSRPWRIHELVPDFRLEDVWALPTPGDAGDFPRLIELMGSFDPGRDGPLPVRALFALRWKIGELLGWDGEKDGVGGRVPSLRERLPADLRSAPAGTGSRDLPFRPLYQLDDECALEIANATVHGVLHLGWVPDDRVAGGFRGEMAVYVKPNGVLGQAYMAAITPFRYVAVYPPMLRALGREWRAATSARA